MNRRLKTILIISFVAFGVCFLSANIAQAAGLVVEFETDPDPLFSETNWQPGDTITRWVKVSNYSGKTQSVITEAINENDPHGLSKQLDLLIKEGDVTLYHDTLFNFFSAPETPLSNLANNNQTKYDFTISFKPTAGNPYQGTSLSFDILVGFKGTEGGEWGRGGASFSPPPSELTILEETVEVTEIGETSVTITWTTTYLSTSRVIFSRYDEPHTLDLSDIPNYGYAHSTTEDSNKVLSHSVTITGLDPGTTYYFRCISHASPDDSISREYSFTTKGVAGEVEKGEEEWMPPAPPSPPTPAVPPVSEQKMPPVPQIAEETEKPPKEEEREKISLPPLEEIEMPKSWQEVLAEKGLGAGLLAAVGTFLLERKLIWAGIAVIIIGSLIFWLVKKREKKESSQKSSW